MSTSPDRAPKAESPPRQPLHAQCKNLACLDASDESLRAAGLPASADDASYRAYHARMHCALAPILEHEFKRFRYATHVVQLSYDEATALLRASQSHLWRKSAQRDHAPAADIGDITPDVSGQVAPAAAVAGVAAASTCPHETPSALAAKASPAVAPLRQRLQDALTSPLFGSRGCTVTCNSVSMRDALATGRFRRNTLEALLRVHVECMDAHGQRSEHSLAQEVQNCLSRALQMHTADELLQGLAASEDVWAELQTAVSFGKELFCATLILTEFQPQIVLHPSCHFRCVVSEGRLLTVSQRSTAIDYAQLKGAEDRILRGVRDWALTVGLPKRMGGQTEYVIDLVVLGPPIIEADEERDCSQSPIATQSPHTPDERATKERKKNASASPSASSAPPASPPSPASGHEDDGHEGVHESEGSRLAPPYPHPYDIRLLHVRAPMKDLSIGLFTWEEVEAIKQSKGDAQCRTLQAPLPDELASAPPLWRSFLEKECQPRSPWAPVWALVQDLAPGTLVAALFIFFMRAFHVPVSACIALTLGGLIAFLLYGNLHHRTKKQSKHSAVRVQSKAMRHRAKAGEKARPADGYSSDIQLPEDEVAESADSAAAHGSRPNHGVHHHRVLLSTPNALMSKIRALDLTPLIRVELSPHASMPFALADQHEPDTAHLKGGKSFMVNQVCGPRLVLRMARFVAGCAHWRCIGRLTGAQILALLLPHERYNFILASSPPRLVISHVGTGTTGGLYAKHALLSDLARVAFAGEMWMDEQHTVHVNNASGTYRPKDQLLPAVEAFLRKALQVNAHAHTRPEDE